MFQHHTDGPFAPPTAEPKDNGGSDQGTTKETGRDEKPSGKKDE